MQKQATWIDRWSKALQGTFGENAPALRGLQLEQLVLDPAGGIALALTLASLPDTVPGRWKDGGFDRLQLRMIFATRALAIRRTDPVGPARVSVELEDNKLHVKSDDGSFELTASFLDARLDFHPYRAKDYEFPPVWYHR
jgi:hypothetical protein